MVAAPPHSVGQLALDLTHRVDQEFNLDAVQDFTTTLPPPQRGQHVHIQVTVLGSIATHGRPCGLGRRPSCPRTPRPCDQRPLAAPGAILGPTQFSGFIPVVTACGQLGQVEEAATRSCNRLSLTSGQRRQGCEGRGRACDSPARPRCGARRASRSMPCSPRVAAPTPPTGR